MIRLSRNSLYLKHAKKIELVSAIAEAQFSSCENGYPWRDEDSDFFTPLPLDKFLWDYLQIRLYPKQAEDLTALLGTDPKLVFESGNGLPQQGLFCWGKGSGKDFVVSCTMIWACHVLLCLKNIAHYLGQAQGENIDVVTVAYTLSQAKTVLFFKMLQRLKHCSWFNGAIERLVPDISPDRYLKEGNGFVGAESVLFPGSLRLWSVPATEAAEGKNPILWCADEIAAFSSPVRMNQASHIHRLLTSSARTRFNDRWRGFMISFPRHGEDYVMQTVKLVNLGKAPDTLATVRPVWEVNPNVTRESLQPDYDRDPQGSACRYECKPPAAIDAYFRSPELLLLHAHGAPLELLRSKLDLPIEQLEVIASLGQNPIIEVDGAGDPKLDHRGFPKLARWFKGQKDLSGEPYEYYVHLDPGLSGDSFGFAIGHNHQMADGTVQAVLDLAFRWTGAMFKDFGEIYRQKWFEDTQEQTEVVTAAEVDFRTVREFLFFLRHDRGFFLRQVSIDNWNSAESKQEMEKRDLAVVNRTVGKEDYDEFKALVYNRQLRYFAYHILIEECYKLQILHGTKVDAPRTKEGEGIKNNSHKDVSDAAASVARYLSFFKGDQIEFYQAPELDLTVDRDKKTGLIADVSPDTLSEAQKEVWNLFLN